ncbi:hypothetical protein ACFVYC_05200 [Pseudarthrobacter sp. NPDC058329]|uniref:hypothetical protein n=1 Tax=Pseudarthrobacter sp. NPDC058329 TaxID=3346448 RepID=UPI0036DCD9A3
MGCVETKDRTTADAAASAGLDVAGAAAAELAAAGTAAEAVPGELLRTAMDKGRAFLRVYVHSRKVRAAADALAQALADSREASSWPGDRLPVGEEMSAQVEKLTHRLKLETEAHHRLEALFRSVDLGRLAKETWPMGPAAG